MNKYNSAKIYKISSIKCDKFYIGSTTLPKLQYRLSVHKNHYKMYLENKHNYMSSYEVVKYDDAVIELVKEVNCENRKELNIEEGLIVRQLKDNILNKNIAGRNQHQYYKDNLVICFCGCIVNKHSLKKHQQSDKHHNYMMELL